ncbi:MAG: hypothetical protein HKO95_18505 [Rhodobacteraceae bacterium]|nr:hypothetical protein [Paracoccaceae bacterium]
MIPPRSVAAVTLAQTVALVPPLAVLATTATGGFALPLFAALAFALGWEGLFALMRKRAPEAHGITTALIVVVLAPADLALWQLGFAVSLGVILGELVFGGRGFGFVSPATAALSLLVISFPQVELAQPTRDLALATVPGLVLLLVLGLISWRILVAVLVTVAVAFALRGAAFDPAALGTALAFGLVFLICDPVSAATTNAGRWVYGALAGALIIVFAGDNPITSEAVVFAALMSSVFAPLIDHLVVLAHTYQRQNRHV